MYNEQLIKQFMPKLKRLSIKYANDNCDEDELFSEGQMYLLEFLASKKSVSQDSELYRKAYKSVSSRLKNYASKSLNNNIVTLSDCNIILVPRSTFDTDLLMQVLEDNLTEKEFTIIVEYYGITTNRKTCIEIAKDFGLSDSRISEIRRQAEFKIKRCFHMNNISMEDLFL